MTIVGRLYEQKQLERIFKSTVAEFVAVYGRRRVGKTYLIREFFQKKSCVFFRSSGVHEGSLKTQLSKFKHEIENTFYKNYQGIRLSDFSSWHDAFQALKDAIDLFAKRKTIVIFLDEIPWMATPRSGLLEALDYYWNRYWSEDKRIKMIICGSAASWIIEQVLHNTGGLHNRVTLRLPIAPFTLAETKSYLAYKKITYKNEQILTLYLCIGGIPFYLNLVEKGLSAILNISRMCFDKKGTLYDEFKVLFASLFKSHEINEKIIRFITTKRGGVSRQEIEKAMKYKGGRLSARLKELEEAGFIAGFVPWEKERGIFYRIIDEYTLFYLTWIAPRAASRIAQDMDESYWEILSMQPRWRAWSGYAFESICLKHLRQIKKALRIPEGSEIFSWRYLPNKTNKDAGAQIDLIFDRPDNFLNLCEIKYNKNPLVIDKKYASHLIQRERIYQTVMKSQKQIFHSMIVAGGIKKNRYSEDIIDSIVDLPDLFKDEQG